MSVSGAASGSSSTPSGVAPSPTGSTNPSGVDWDALIQAQVDAKKALAVSVEAKMTGNENKIAAYKNLQGLLSTLATSASPFSTTNGASASDSIFNARLASVSANGDFPQDSVLQMTLNNGAAFGKYTLEIDSLAQAQKVSGAIVPSQTDALGYNGTFSIGLAGGASASIKVDPTMSLQELVANINAQTQSTNVEASILQVSGNQFEIHLTGIQDNVDIVTSSTSGDDVMGKLGVTDASGNFTDQIQAAQAANIVFDGVKITRNTNDISDVLTNVTFHLLQPTPAGGSLNIDIGTNSGAIEDAMQTLVTNYNAFRDAVVAQQQTGPDGTAAAGTVLFGDSTMTDIMSQLQSAFSTSVGGLSLNDLGLSLATDGSNHLDFDASVLDATLTSNLQGAEAMLASQATTSSGELSVVAAGAGTAGSFKLDLAVDASGKLVSASVGGDSSMFTITGSTIIGKSGTPYAGMAFGYSGTTSQSIEVDATPGIASLLNGVAATNSDSKTGSLQNLMTDLSSRDETLQQQDNDIQSQATALQTQLQDQYSKYQSAIAQAASTMNFLTALLNSKSNN